MKAVVKLKKLFERPRELDLGVDQLARMRGTKPLLSALLDVGSPVEGRRPVLTLHLEVVEHTARLIQQNYPLDSAGVEDSRFAGRAARLGRAARIGFVPPE